MRKSAASPIFLAKKPVHLILHVTGRCNLRCRTCFVDFDSYEEDLTLDEIGGMAAYLKGLIWLDISGGEPYLRKDLADICARFDAGSITIPTNGFDPELIRATTREIRERVSGALTVAVSIDGFEKTNDYIRQKGSFADSIRTLESLKTVKGIRLKVNTVLCDRNYSEIIDFMGYIKQYDVDFHSIVFLRAPIRGRGVAPVPYKDLAAIQERVFDFWDSYDFGFKGVRERILRNYLRSMYASSLRVMDEKTQVPPCLAGKRHLVIYPDGDVSFCETLAPFGNLRKESMETLLKGRDAEARRKAIRERRCCCWHNCNMLDNHFLNPLRYPGLLGNIKR